LGGLRWAGIEDTYFAVLLVPPAGSRRAILDTLALPEIKGGATGRGLADVVSGFDSPAHKSPVVAVPLAEGESVQVFAGPKDYPILAAMGGDLKEVVPVGEWLGPIVVPLMALLRWMHGFIGNYGWAIVLLTVIINVLMAPFRHYSIVNGMKMSKLAPEMRVIQERYRKVPLMDPKRAEMQEEINALYARHGMNMGTQMLVGCLPLLLTMPFFIAFYRMLSASIDLRGASFLWIPDLSQKDPLYLTPVLMGLSMAATAFLTPTTADPAQRRIQMLLPIMFVVFLFSAPAGLNVYWLCSNLCGITQQGLTMLFMSGSGAALATKARARKK
jgi:YidC/Oxa1 family membrane protein insertase